MCHGSGGGREKAGGSRRAGSGCEGGAGRAVWVPWEGRLTARPTRLPLDERHAGGAVDLAAPVGDLDLFAGLVLAQEADQFIEVAGGPAIDGGDDIADAEAG